MAAPWSAFEEIVNHIFRVVPGATPTRSDFLQICYANDISDDVVDGFDALREGVMFNSADEVREALQQLGQIED